MPVTPAASTRPYDVQNYLTTAEDRAAYLEAALEDGDTEIIHHRERWANELRLIYADGRAIKLTESPAKKEDETDGECTSEARAA